MLGGWHETVDAVPARRDSGQVGTDFLATEDTENKGRLWKSANGGLVFRAKGRYSRQEFFETAIRQKEGN